MKKNIIFLVILTMIGCSDHKEDAIKEVVKGNLKDPQSAQFQNLYGYCGEVNSKNSYGGYVGFKKYIVVNQTVLMEDSEGVDPSKFSIIWQAHCTPNKGEFKHEVRLFQKPYDNQQAEQISLMV